MYRILSLILLIIKVLCPVSKQCLCHFASGPGKETDMRYMLSAEIFEGSDDVVDGIGYGQQEVVVFAFVDKVLH